MDAKQLVQACDDDGSDAGILIRTVLQPLAGPGTPVKPAVYQGGRYQLDRRWYGEDDERQPADVIVIDNVPSQANRLEAALRRLRDALGLPEIILDLSSLEPLPAHLPRSLSSFQFPHRQADAYLRDAQLGGTPFPKTEFGKRLFDATREDALALLEWFPQALLYGFWQSHLGKKRTQAKLARSWVSEIIGIRPGATDTKSLGVKGDPLNLSDDAVVSFNEDDVAGWTLTQEKKAKGPGKKTDSLSNIGHGQVPFKRDEEAPAGVSFDHIEQRATLSLAGLRQIRVGNPEENAAARAIVAALGLSAHTAAFGSAYQLRSGCDLRSTATTWTWLGESDARSLEPLDRASANQLFEECVGIGQKAGLPVGANWPAPLTVSPTVSLTDSIRKTWPVLD